MSGQGADAGLESPATPVFSAPTVTDNCDSAPVLSVIDVTNQLCGATYKVTRTWTATDACGNVSAPVSQTITITDHTAPAISYEYLYRVRFQWQFCILYLSSTEDIRNNDHVPQVRFQ